MLAVNQTGELGETHRERSRQTNEQTANQEKDQSFLLRAAHMAMERGAQSKAKTLLQSLAAIFPPPGKEGEPNDQAPPAAPTTVEPTIALGDILAPIRKEGGGSFIIGEVPDHAYRGLPSYYNKNVKAMKGSIPLTIFNPKWQQQAAAHHAEKKTFDKNNPGPQQMDAVVCTVVTQLPKLYWRFARHLHIQDVLGVGPHPQG
ncbi:hypothetical protein PCANC_14416 [Puccinia coronata f. sp. avenae]|uniref:Uncharacterized protein n=1 Tax=Puccinia coronata f. sp. avenae TaxID=200324 RepID=A0A2N5UZE9_9BASI|nr:hypothetical protein PCANC_14416 [Puccinia coronata f. sp. avenae]